MALSVIWYRWFSLRRHAYLAGGCNQRFTLGALEEWKIMTDGLTTTGEFSLNSWAVLSNTGFKRTPQVYNTTAI